MKEKLISLLIIIFIVMESICLVNAEDITNEEESKERAALEAYFYDKYFEEPEFLSDRCETFDIEDGKNFINSIYKEVLKDQYDFYRGAVNSDFTMDDLEQLTIGEPYYEYNVDGRNLAVVYFPVYLDEKAVSAISLIYVEGCWIRAASPEVWGGLLLSWKMLDEMDYPSEQVIFYSINNKYYAESKKKCVLIWEAENLINEEKYSQEEEKFLNLSFEEKKEKYENEFLDLSEYSADAYEADADRCNVSSVTGGETTKVTEKSNKYNLAIILAGGVILLAAVTGIVLLKRKKMKFKRE